MTSPKRRANVLGVWCLFLVCAVLRGDTSAPTGFIVGSVLDETPDCTPEKCALLANSKTKEDLFRILRPAVATAGGRDGQSQRRRDSHGHLCLPSVPRASAGQGGSLP